MYEVNSPNVVDCYDHWIEPCTDFVKKNALGNSDFEKLNAQLPAGHKMDPFNGLVLFKVIERCDTDLDKWLRQNTNATSKQKWDIFRQVVNGVCDLHSHNIVHRDLKPHNILLNTKDGRITVKITDLGMCRFIPKPESKPKSDGTDSSEIKGDSKKPQDVFLPVVGCPGLMQSMLPKQVLVSEAKSLDIYAIGILLKILFKMYRSPDASLDYGPPDTELDEDQLVAKDIIRSLCSHLPEDRPTIEEVRTLVSPSARAAHERVETITAQLIRQSQINAVKTNQWQCLPAMVFGNLSRK